MVDSISKSGKVTCPNCGEPADEFDQFCGFCKADLSAAKLALPAEKTRFCPSCQSTRIRSDGYCEDCGDRVPDDARNHFDIALSRSFAGVCDIGRKGTVNQDGMAMELIGRGADTMYVAVVCDGVSRSSASDLGSMAAAGCAIEVLAGCLRRGENVVASMRLAVRKAHAKTLEAGRLAGFNEVDGPQTTMVLLVVRGGRAYVSWVGDSRAYWVSASGSGLLTRDHSFVNDATDLGIMSMEEALASEKAHAITRSLGAGEESVDGPLPGVNILILPEEPVTFLLCSDGLWNYEPDEKRLADLIRRNDDSSALALCRNLLKFALDSGGRDNITIVALSL